MTTQQQALTDTTLMEKIKKTAPWVVLVLLVYLLINGYMILRLGLHQDEVYDFRGEETGLYAAAGRWGIVLWRYMFGEGACLYAAGITAGICTAVTVVWQTELLRLQDTFSKLIYCAFYLGCTQYAYMHQYAFLSDACAASLLVVTAAIWLLTQQGKAAIIGSILCTAFALGTYQATCFYFGALWLAVELQMQLQAQGHKGLLRRFGKLAVVSLSAIVLWWGIKQLTMQLPIVTDEHIRYATGYQQKLTGWSAFLQGDFADKLSTVAHIFRYIFWSQLGRIYTGQWVYATAIIPLVLISVHIWKSKTGTSVILRYVLLLALWVLPHCLIIILLQQQPPHTLLAEPIAVATLWALSAPLFPDFAKKVFFLFAPFMLMKAAYITSDKAKIEALEHDICVAELRMIRTQATALSTQAGLPPDSTIILCGEPDFPSKDNAPQLRSLYLLKYYLKTYKLSRMRIATPTELSENADILRQMPAWPATGSVQHNQRDVIIKLGNGDL